MTKLTDGKYKQLEDEFYTILCPCVGANEWAYATSRKSVNELIEAVKRFIEDENGLRTG